MNSKFISSMQNATIKNIQLLQKKKAERKKQELFIIEGIKSVNDIPDDYHIEYYITADSFDESELTMREDVKWLMVTDEIFKAISDTETPQGAMAIVRQKKYQLSELTTKETPFYLVIDNIQDPGNLGTIIRSAYGFGVDAIFVSKGSVDLYSPKTVRSTMGAIFHVPIVTDIRVSECIQWLKEKETVVYATALEESNVLYQNDFRRSSAIIIGNEANGVSEQAKEMADKKVRIPMPGGLESLNASIAASISMYEVMKQRQS